MDAQTKRPWPKEQSLQRDTLKIIRKVVLVLHVNRDLGLLCRSLGVQGKGHLLV